MTTQLGELILGREFFERYETPSEFKGSHYSFATLPDTLNWWAEYTASLLHETLKGRTPIFVFSGYSGAAHATALSLAYYRQHGATFGMIYVRKKHEKSHSDKDENEFSKLSDHNVIVFVDDLVDSGSTLVYTLSRAVKVLQKFDKPFDTTHYIEVLKSSIAVRDRLQAQLTEE